MTRPEDMARTDQRAWQINEILRALEVLTEPGQVVELRIPEAEGIKGRTDSGYFKNYGELAKVAASYTRRAHGVYVTLNPVNPDLFARSADAVKERAKLTTSDGDILRRRWLPIDLDPERPSGISSTDAEHAAALERAGEIADWLRAFGWPEPVRADSGNGCHLLYRIDLPNDDAAKSLIEGCLHVIAERWTDGAVKVDRSVGNAARIWKLYGTLSAKGDDIEERPHRFSRLLSVPDQVEPVPFELLEAMAEKAKVLEDPAPSTRAPHKGQFEVESFIERHQATLNPHPQTSNRGMKSWRIDCPWSESHRGDAWVIEFSSGAWSAGCYHDSCSWGHVELRDRLEPGSRTNGMVRTNGAGPGGMSDAGETPKRGKPQIDIYQQASGMADEALRAIIQANEDNPSRPILGVRGGNLARVNVDETGHASIEAIDRSTLLSIVADVADWVRISEKDTLDASPDDKAVTVLHRRGNWPGLPILEGISSAPVFGKDGTLHDKPGYDPRTRIFNAGNLELGDTTPTPTNVQAAVNLLLDDLLVDFPFVDEASRAHAVALAILPFVRHMIDGATPLHLVSAPSHGAGKSLLVESCLIPALGEEPEATTVARSGEEWGKLLTTVIMAGKSVVFLDNVDRPLEGSAMATALTQARWSDRILGQSKAMSAPIRCTWAATAANPTTSEEIARRCALIRLDPNMERPSERTGFKHEHLKPWAKKHRAELAGAIVTIVRNWLDKGAPAWKKRTKGSYERWVQIMGGILESAGIPGFLDNEDAMRDTSPTTLAMAKFVEAWMEKHGSDKVSSADLWPLASEPDRPSELDTTEYLNLLAPLLGSGNETSRKTRLGRVLSSNRDKIFGGWKIQVDPHNTDRKGGRLYFLQPVGGGRGSSADVEPQTSANVGTDLLEVEGGSADVADVHFSQNITRARAHTHTDNDGQPERRQRRQNDESLEVDRADVRGKRRQTSALEQLQAYLKRPVSPVEIETARGLAQAAGVRLVEVDHPTVKGARRLTIEDSGTAADGGGTPESLGL